jgi:hypothetical protein
MDKVQNWEIMLVSMFQRHKPAYLIIGLYSRSSSAETSGMLNISGELLQWILGDRFRRKSWKRILDGGEW